MTNNEILQADVLDILFEHRNKAYGAYTLRRNYQQRLLLALAGSLSIVAIVFFFMVFNKSSEHRLTAPAVDKNTVTTVVVDIHSLKPPSPQPKPNPAVVAQKDFRTFRIVKDRDVVKPVATQDEIKFAAISDKDVNGQLPTDLSKSVTNTVPVSGDNASKEKEQQTIHPVETAPSFPGGLEALGRFFARTLQPPEELLPGERKVVLVRFVVGIDGTISKTEILQSAGDVYDREVLRALRKMPRWNPAEQNGMKVAVSFTQPVTFVGLDQ